MGQYTVDQNTVALLHFDDGYKDECGNVWTPIAAPDIDTSIKKFGNSSITLYRGKSLKATNDKFKFGTGDFTIDFWVYAANLQDACFLSSAPYTNDSVYGVGMCSTGMWIGNKQAVAGIHPYLLPDRIWVHMALVRKQDTMLFFLGGKLQGQVNLPAGTAISSDTFGLAYRYASGEEVSTNQVWLDELRISNVARWTEPFTPPDGPYEPPTPPAPSDGDRCLLVVSMFDERKEYELTKTELEAFLSWYNAKANGSGQPYYVFKKKFNLGPFVSRKDHLVFDKIIDFEVKSY